MPGHTNLRFQPGCVLHCEAALGSASQGRGSQPRRRHLYPILCWTRVSAGPVSNTTHCGCFATALSTFTEKLAICLWAPRGIDSVDLRSIAMRIGLQGRHSKYQEVKYSVARTNCLSFESNGHIERRDSLLLTAHPGPVRGEVQVPVTV